MEPVALGDLIDESVVDPSHDTSGKRGRGRPRVSSAADKIIETLEPVTPKSVARLPRTVENSPEILMAYMYDGLAFLNAVAQCKQLPIGMRSEAAEKIVDAGLQLSKGTRTMKPGSGKDVADEDLASLADALQNLQGNVPFSPGTPASVEPEEEDVPEGWGEENPSETDQEETEGTPAPAEHAPTPFAFDIPRPNVQGKSKTPLDHRILTLLERKGGTCSRKTIQEYTRNGGWTIADIDDCLQKLIDSGKVRHEKNQPNNRNWYSIIKKSQAGAA